MQLEKSQITDSFINYICILTVNKLVINIGCQVYLAYMFI